MYESYLENIFIPLIVAAACLYYAYQLLVRKNIDAVRSKSKGRVKNPEEYAQKAGRLVLFLAVASGLMALLMYFSYYLALVEITVAFIYFGTSWKRLEEKYGA